jgi:hypothetical protein
MYWQERMRLRLGRTNAMRSTFRHSSSFVCQEIPRLLYYLKFHYRVHKSQPLIPVHTSLPYLFTVRFNKIFTYTWFGYEVPGIILLRDLQGAMLLDHSKDMSMHVSTCTSYNFNALTPIV